MLVLTRRANEGVVIGDSIVVTLVEVRGDKARLGVVAPKDMSVCRKEIWDALRGIRSLSIIDPTWLAWQDGTIRRLAQSMAETQNYDALPILADALEEAGCTDAAILEHCRTAGRRKRDSWVIDLILSAP